MAKLSLQELYRMGAVVHPTTRLEDGRLPYASSESYHTNPDRPSHEGVDFAYHRAAGEPIVSGERKWYVPPGVPAVATSHGYVQSAKSVDRPNGGTVVINIFSGPADPSGKHSTGWKVMYLHLARIDVQVGDIVRPGQQIGIVGHGKDPFIHLHFELHPFGVWDAQDPLPFLDGANILGFHEAAPGVFNDLPAPIAEVAGTTWSMLAQLCAELERVAARIKDVIEERIA